MLTKVLNVKKTLITLSVIVISACTSQVYEKNSALLPADSAQARTEIIKLVSQSLGGKKIAIAKDVFQHSSRLLLGKTAVTSPVGINVIRSDQVSAIVFELIKQGDNCLLRRINTTQEWQLKTKNCFKA
jgi:hypothetical protein